MWGIEPRNQGGRIAGFGTAVPRYPASQTQIARFLEKAAAAQPDARPGFLRQVGRFADKSAIETRYSVLPDYVAQSPEQFTFYPPSWDLEPFPSTSDRMRVFEQESVRLAETAARAALADANISAAAVTHVVLTSCTGFFAPGPDIALASRLGLASSVQRTIIGFMGCYAGINGLRTADQIARSDPRAVVLQISVELCSLHFQKTATLSTLAANTLFSDGAGAAIIVGEQHALPSHATIVGSCSNVAPDSEGQMSWRIGDHGFIMELGPEVPARLQAHAKPFVEALLSDHAATLTDVVGWAVHPGGPRIIDAIGTGVGLESDRLASARKILKLYGNMSSATILFVIKEELERLQQPGLVVALGFGPGLTMEGLLLRADPDFSDA